MPLYDLTSEIASSAPSSLGLVLDATPTDAEEIDQLAEEIRRHQQAELERPLAVTRNPISDFMDTMLVRRREEPFDGRELPAFLSGGGDRECTLSRFDMLRKRSHRIGSCTRSRANTQRGLRRGDWPQWYTQTQAGLNRLL